MVARRAMLILGVIVLVMGCASSAPSVAPQSVTAPSPLTAGSVASLPTAPRATTPTTTASVIPSVAATAPPTTSPTTPASYAVLEPLPASLSYRWSGDPRDVPSLGSSTRTGLNFTTNTFSLTGTEYGYEGILRATAGLSPQGELELVSTADESDCGVGDRGDYPWSLSPGATILTIQAGVDACAARAALMVGEWARIDCKIVDSGCLGDLEAGDHRSQYILPRLDPDAPYVPDLGAVTYTVPAGWSNAEDFPAEFRLTPSADYALEGNDGPTGDSYHQIFMGVAPAAIADVLTCDRATPVDSSASVSGLIGFLKGPAQPDRQRRDENNDRRPSGRVDRCPARSVVASHLPVLRGWRACCQRAHAKFS